MSDSLSIVSTDRKDGRAEHKMVIRVMLQVVKRIVVLQEPLKGIGRAMEEEGGGSQTSRLVELKSLFDIYFGHEGILSMRCN